jgi:predicted nucleic acid-binding protein
MICLDTTVLIWGVQGVAQGLHRQHMIERTDRYLKSLRRKNETLMVPAPVLAEYLQGFADPRQRAAQLRAFQEGFFVPPFDLPSAFLAAELSQSPEVAKLAQEGDRKAIKTDVQIIAIAIVHQADLIVTGNASEFRRIAGGKILISEVPDVAVQQELDYSPE